jgi:hypothetical protein
MQFAFLVIKRLWGTLPHPSSASVNIELRREIPIVSKTSMIGHTFASLSPAYIAAGLAVLLLGVQAWIRVRYAFKVRAAGGVHAPSLARDPFTGVSLY